MYIIQGNTPYHKSIESDDLKLQEYLQSESPVCVVPCVDDLYSIGKEVERRIQLDLNEVAV